MISFSVSPLENAAKQRTDVTWAEVRSCGVAEAGPRKDRSKVGMPFAPYVAVWWLIVAVGTWGSPQRVNTPWAARVADDQEGGRGRLLAVYVAARYLRGRVGARRASMSIDR